VKETGNLWTSPIHGSHVKSSEIHGEISMFEGFFFAKLSISLGPRPVRLPTFPVGSCVGKLSDCGLHAKMGDELELNGF
jgi:hypothetical protein